jgi:hypothetical protein
VNGAISLPHRLGHSTNLLLRFHVAGKERRRLACTGRWRTANGSLIKQRLNIRFNARITNNKHNPNPSLGKRSPNKPSHRLTVSRPKDDHGLASKLQEVAHETSTIATMNFTRKTFLPATSTRPDITCASPMISGG